MSTNRSVNRPRTIRRAGRVEVPLEEEPRRRREIPVNALPLILLAGFAMAILIGTVLLMLPFASSEGSWTSPVIACCVRTERRAALGDGARPSIAGHSLKLKRSWSKRL